MVKRMVCWAVFCVALVSLQGTYANPSDSGRAFDLQGFVDRAIEAGQDPVVIPPGRYRVAPRNRQHLVLKGLDNVHILAQGVEMVCTETTRAITISGCRNVTLMGLTIDYDPLPYTQGRITKLSPDKKIHDIELFDGYPAADEVQDFKYEIFRSDTRTLRFGSYHQFHAEVLGPQTIRVTRGGSYQGEEVGDIIAIGTRHAPGGQIPHAVYVTDSDAVILEGVTLYASNCFGFFETRCRRTRYSGCRIDRRVLRDDLKKREAPRIRSLNADAFHSKHAEAGPHILECTARFQGDDCVNICGDYHMVMASEGDRLRVLAKGQLNIQPGDPVEVVTYDGRRLPDARCVTVKRLGVLTDAEQGFMAKQRMHKPFKEGAIRDIYEVRIDRAEPLVRGSIVGAANRMGNGFKVQGCNFGFNRSRGILIKASSGELSNNRLTACWGEAIKVSPEYWWLESGSSSDLRIAGNHIKDCLGKGIAVYALAGTGEIAPAGAHNGIVIADNTIANVQDAAIWVTSTRNLTLQNNRVDEDAVVKLERCDAVRSDADITEAVETVMSTNPGPSGWVLAWTDNFDGNALDDNNWTRCKRGTPDWKNTMSDDPRLLKVEDGVLHLRGIVNDTPDEDPAPYLTAGVTSRGKFSFQYGKVQIRARFKSAQGAWPALWMLGAEKGWPANGEIDLMEHLNFDSIVYQTVHSEYTIKIDKTNTPKKGSTAKIDRDDWNTYGCEWQPDKIVFTVNGKPTHTYPRVPDLGEKQWPFNQPFYFILSMQIGGNWVNGSGPTNPAHYPAGMEIDWVRVHERKK